MLLDLDPERLPKARAAVVRAPSRQLDQFYTRPEVAAACVAATRAWLGDSPPVRWIEPSAGAGAFVRALGGEVTALDIAPAADGIARADFLDWSTPAAPPGVRTIVIGNPPFGKNASLAVRFVNRAAHFADAVAFIVPRTFEKASTHRKLDPYLALAVEMPLDAASFELDGEPYAVPVVFQIWTRQAAARAVERPPLQHADFDFVRTPAEADFAVQRVGARAGLVSREGLQKAAQSHYFIRSRTAGAVAALLASIDWDPIKLRTAGCPSIGKAELVAAYREAKACRTVSSTARPSKTA